MKEWMKKQHWISLAGVTALMLLALAILFTGCSGDENTETPVSDPQETETEAEPVEISGQLWWNVERETYAGKAEGGGSGRSLSKDDGAYHILFATEGRQVTRRCKEKRLVNKIDANDVMGLQFDEEGFIVGVYPITDVSQGFDIEGLYVKEVREDGTFLLNSSYSMAGRDFETSFPADLRIFNVSGIGPSGTFVGVELSKKDLAKGDRIYTVIGLDGTVTRGFVTQRFIKVDIYWNIERKYDADLLSTTREPDENGEYVIPMAVNGEQVEVRVRSRALATAIDKQAAKCHALDFDQDGYVIRVKSAGATMGGGTWGSWATIFSIDERDVTAEKLSGSDKGTKWDGRLAEDVEIYDMSGQGAFIGEKTELRLYDQVHGLKKTDGTIGVLFVVGRTSNDPVYWNVERQYDSSKKVTKRTPAADGYYYIKMAADGKQYMLKTKDKEIATKVDSYAARCMGLKLDGDVILGTYSASSTRGTGGGTKASWHTVLSVKGNTFHAKKLQTTASDYNNEEDITMAPDCIVVNGSVTFNSYCGELTTVRVEDQVHCLMNPKGEAAVVFVVSRPVSLPISFNLNRKYDSKNKVTTRVPDADGYYHFTVAMEGGTRELRTNKKEFANRIDGLAASCFAFALNGDVITKIYSASETLLTNGGTHSSWADVTKVNSAASFTTLKDPKSTSSDAGKTVTAKMASNCKIINVSGLYEDHAGEYTQIRVGDRVHCFKNKSGLTTFVFIVGRSAPSVEKECPVCGKVVTWKPYAGSFAYEADPTVPIHYYQTGNRVPNGGMGPAKQCVLHYDMNGYSVLSNDGDRSFSNLQQKSDVYVMDLSEAGTSKIVTGTGLQAAEGKTVNGSSLSIAYVTGSLHIYGIDIDASKVDSPRAYGAFYVPTNAVLELRDVNFIGGKTLSGSAIYSKGQVLLKNTTLTGGTVSEGGMITLTSTASLTLSGKISISGGLGTDGANANAYLQEGALIKTDNGFTADKPIGVTSEFSGFFTETGFAAYESSFVSDRAGGSISASEDKLSITCAVTGIAFPSQTLAVEAGTSTPLQVNVLPQNPGDAVITYTLSNTSAAYLDGYNNLIALSETASPITVTAKMEGTDFQATLSVTVTASTSDHRHCVCGNLYANQEELPDGQKHRAENMAYKAWTGTTTLPTYKDCVSGKNYFVLQNDVTLEGNWRPAYASATDYTVDMSGMEIILCLNGHTVTSTRSVVLSTLTGESKHAANIKITLTDCSAAPGKFIMPENKDNGTSAMMWLNANGTEVNIYRITLDGNGLMVQRNGAIFSMAYTSVLNLYGGTVKGGDTVVNGTTTYGGGLIYVGASAAFNMYGGTLEGGSACAEGGLIKNLGMTSIYGGTLNGGRGTQGGNIYSTGTVVLRGATLMNGNATTGRGGNIMMDTNSTADFKNTNFVGGTSVEVGGNVYLKATGGALIDTCIFNGGQTTGSVKAGGNMHIAASATIRNSVFTSGAATNGTANAIHMNSSTATLILDSVLIEGSSFIQGANAVVLSGKNTIGSETAALTFHRTAVKSVTLSDFSAESAIFVKLSATGTDPFVITGGAAYTEAFTPLSPATKEESGDDLHINQ